MNTFQDFQDFSRFLDFCPELFNFFCIFIFKQKFEFPTLFAHFEANFEANFEAQIENQKWWELKSRLRYL